MRKETVVNKMKTKTKRQLKKYDNEMKKIRKWKRKNGAENES